MNGFETFSADSWIIDGLSRHPAIDASSAPRKRNASSASLTRVFSSTIACAMLTSLSLAGATVSRPVFAFGASLAALQVDQNFVVGLPAAYWSHAISEVRSWPALKEQEISDPPLLF